MRVQFTRGTRGRVIGTAEMSQVPRSGEGVLLDGALFVAWNVAWDLTPGAQAAWVHLMTRAEHDVAAGAVTRSVPGQ